MPAPVRHCLLLLAVGSVMFFVNLGVPRLWDDDEAIFAQAAWEMMDRGDLVVPYFNGRLFPDKPALMYWCMIAGYELFGPTEFGARFWSAIFGLGTVLLTYHLGTLLFCRPAGFWAGMILASSLNFDVIARAATPDSLLTFFCTLALVVFVRGTGVRTRAASNDETAETVWPEGQVSFTPTWRTYALAYAAMGVAVLVKGPIGVLLPTAVMGLFLLIMRREERAGETSAGNNALCDAARPPLPPLAKGGNARTLPPLARGGRGGRADYREALHQLAVSAWHTFSPTHFLRTLWTMRPLTAMAMVLLVAGPWYAWVGLRSDGEWPARFFGVHNFGRFFHAMENHRGPLFYYIPAILIGFFPWIVFLTPTVLQFAQRVRERHPWRPGYLFLCCWIIVIVGFFSLASTKLPSYVVPCYPALALLTGCFVHSWLTEAEALAKFWIRWAWVTLLVIGLGITIVVPIVAHVYLGGDLLLALPGLAPLVGGCIGLYLSECGRVRQAAATFAVTAVAFITCLFGFAAVRVDRHQSSEMFANLIRTHSHGHQPQVASFGYFRPSLVFYSKERIDECQSVDEARDFFCDDFENPFLFVTDEEYPQLASVLPPGVTVLESRPRFLKDGTILLLGRSTATAQQISSTSLRQ